MCVTGEWLAKKSTEFVDNSLRRAKICRFRAEFGNFDADFEYTPVFLAAVRDSSGSNHCRNAGSSGCENARYLQLCDFQEASQDGRIELCAAPGVQATDRLGMVESFAVTAVGDHGVEGIHDRYNS